MSLLDRFFPGDLSAVEIERIAQGLPVAPAAPSGRMKCLGESPTCLAACDVMKWSLWRDDRSGAIWVHCAGGIVDVNVWYGPGPPRVIPATAPPSP